MIVIDGGDGTVRDVLSLAPRHFPNGLPQLLVVPSGKTNALALDLGIPRHWTVQDALSTLGTARIVTRRPLEIRYEGARSRRLHGFLFGTGAFVRATQLAQKVHRVGAFNGLAVGLSLVGAIGQTLFGGRHNAWRRGEPMTIDLGEGQAAERQFYLVVGSTLERLPLGLKPFGPVRSGLKLLGIDAPPRYLPLSEPALIAGSDRQWLSEAGYKRAHTDSFRLKLGSSFVLDGETFPGGDLSIGQGAPIDFVVPG